MEEYSWPIAKEVMDKLNLVRPPIQEWTEPKEETKKESKNKEFNKLPKKQFLLHEWLNIKEGGENKTIEEWAPGTSLSASIVVDTLNELKVAMTTVFPRFLKTKEQFLLQKRKELNKYLRNRLTYLENLILNPAKLKEKGGEPLNEAPFNRTRIIVKDLTALMTENILPIPDIDYVPDGSIDIYFVSEKYKILINISNENKYIEIYGKPYEKGRKRLNCLINDPESIRAVIKDWLNRIL